MSFWRRRSIFDVFEELIRDMEELFYDFEREIERALRSGALEVRGPYVYGFRITIGPDGKPRIEEFGNIKRRGRRAEIREEMEPLVDVFEERDKVVIVAEMPGVEKDKIDVRIKDNTLIISASDTNRKYYKEIELPAKVKPETAKAKYKNGVLEITIEKEVVEEKEKGIKIEVE